MKSMIHAAKKLIGIRVFAAQSQRLMPDAGEQGSPALCECECSQAQLDNDVAAAVQPNDTRIREPF